MQYSRKIRACAENGHDIDELPSDLIEQGEMYFIYDVYSGTEPPVLEYKFCGMCLRCSSDKRLIEFLINGEAFTVHYDTHRFFKIVD